MTITHMDDLRGLCRFTVDAAFIHPKAFARLLEYSTTLPTGTTPGKVWKRDARWWDRGGSEWMLGQFGNPYPEGHKHHGSIPILWRRLVVIGAPPQWDRSVRVPRRRTPARGVITL
jgi:hypothetical protein